MTITSIEPQAGQLRAGALLALCLLFAGCERPSSEDSQEEAESWSVTAWGRSYEVFPEVEPLVVGSTSKAHTHVTRLSDFSPMLEGRVEMVLSGASGDQIFSAEEPIRPGIFALEILPDHEGEFDLSFRISTAESSEEIRGGRVRVGTPERPGGLLVAPAPKGGSDGGEPLPFLKEEQWRSAFATTWVRKSRLARSVSGLARVRPPAGGETSLTSPVDGVVHTSLGSDSWPFVGKQVEQGDLLFRVVPRIAVDRSLSALEAELAALEAELETARSRVSGLEELFELEATSRRELDEARVLARTLEARRSAAQHDLEVARSSREGGSAGGLAIRAPFAGRIAAVEASPGSTVGAGQGLARLVRTDLVWLDISLSPSGSRQVMQDGAVGVVLSDSESPPIRIEDGLRLISVAPEVSPRTGTVAVLLQAPPTAGLTLGTTLEAEVLLGADRDGIVIPSSAVIDDGGVSIVYLQTSGESFVRQHVEVLERQGKRVLVDRLQPGQRLVTVGGESIRRSSLMSSGEAHGHVH